MELAEINARREPRTYAYRFDWTSPFMEGALGACHSLEVPFVFGTLTDPRLALFTGCSPEALALAEWMQDAWIRFIRTGSPGPAWPAYEPEHRQTMIIGTPCSVESAPAEEERRLLSALG
jgi:para-nitrobenzyl esterase